MEYSMQIVKVIMIGLIAGIYSFDMKNIVDQGAIKRFGVMNYNSDYIAAAGSGVDSSNDGVAVGLGIISGISILSSALVLISFEKNQKLDLNS